MGRTHSNTPRSEPTRAAAAPFLCANQYAGHNDLHSEAGIDLGHRCSRLNDGFSRSRY
jgi:hypothetical protein